jgi:hypothetical protein
VLCDFSVCARTDGVDEPKDCIEVLVVLEVLLYEALDLAVFGKDFRFNNAIEDRVVFEVPIEYMQDITAFKREIILL